MAELSDVIEIDTREGRVRRMKQNVLTSARLISERPGVPGFRRPKAAMLTLTYARDGEWQPKHITALLKCIRSWAKRRDVSIPYVWVAELTKRGRVHYHVLLWLPRGFSIPKPDLRGWWTHGSSRIEWAKCAGGYLAKYASKATGATTYPKGARISGSGGLESSERQERRWWLLPSWLRDSAEVDQDWKRAPSKTGGGFWSQPLRLAVASPFRLVAAAAGWVRVVRVGPPQLRPLGPESNNRPMPPADTAGGKHLQVYGSSARS
jgi:hypothetical protein